MKKPKTPLEWHPQIKNVKHGDRLIVENKPFVCHCFSNKNGSKSVHKYFVPEDLYPEFETRWLYYQEFLKFWYENYKTSVIDALPFHAWPAYFSEPKHMNHWRVQINNTDNTYHAHFEKDDFFKDNPETLKANLETFLFCQFGPNMKKCKCKMCNKKLLKRRGIIYRKDKAIERVFYDILELHHYLFVWGDSILKSKDEKGNKNEPSVIFKKYNITENSYWQYFIELIICVIPVCLHCHKLQHIPHDNKGDIYHFKKTWWHRKKDLQIRPWILQSEANFEICKTKYPGQIPEWLTFEDCVDLNTFRSDRKNKEKTAELVEKIFG